MSFTDPHSPGPWQARITEHHAHINDFAGELVALLPRYTGNRPPAEQDANAALIAAAPVLFDACRIAEAALANISVTQRKVCLQQTLQHLRAILQRLEAKQ